MSDWKSEWHLGPSLLMYGTLGAIIIWVLSGAVLAQNSEPEPRVMCTSVGGPIFIGKDWPVSVPLKCCPAGSFISDSEHHVDTKGNLICYREKT